MSRPIDPESPESAAAQRGGWIPDKTGLGKRPTPAEPKTDALPRPPREGRVDRRG